MTPNVLPNMKVRSPRWHDLLDVRTIDSSGDPQADLKEPTYENVEVGELFGPEVLPLTQYRAMRYDFIMGSRNALSGVTGSNNSPLAHPGSFSNELFEIYTLNYAASKIVGVHASEEIWLEQAASVGENIVLSGEFVEKYEKRGQGYAVVSGEARDQAGNLLARRLGTEIMRTVPGDVVGRKASSGSSARRMDTTVDRSARRVGPNANNFSPGDWFEFDPHLVTFEQAALYSRFGEYVTSIHGSMEAAQSAGLKVPIVQGQQQMCLLLDGFFSLIGPRFHSGGHIAAKFIGPVRVFSELTLQGRVFSCDGTPSTTRFECWLTDETGRTVTVATAEWTEK
ncbi:hypothetical protein AOC05_00430 [Arthrobacter alpinus]|uniref:MaoC-like domain-containing protein n=1 Tax=Arthrobacter alpinus TaxID=656366 RepID=A0A0M3UFE4_9MICC|nr:MULTISPECIES: MaoC family dehydratase [Arthrobacter]ALE91185.1 hypothetical protein AOC05_00430 [Arthrobacter alpinus]